MNKQEKLEYALMKMVDALECVTTEVNIPDNLHVYKQIRGIENKACKEAILAFQDYQNSKD